MERYLPYLVVVGLGVGLAVALGYAAVRGLDEAIGRDAWGVDEPPWEPDDTPFPVADEPEVSRAFVGPRGVSRALPRTLADLEGGASVLVMRARLEAGEPRALDALSSLIADASRTSWEGLADVLPERATPAYCEHLLRLADARSAPALVFELLTDCDDAASWRAIADDPRAHALREELLAEGTPFLPRDPRWPVELRLEKAGTRVELVAGLAEDDERDRVVRALVRCATRRPSDDGPGWVELACLEALSGESWALARAAAHAISAWEQPSADLEEAVTTLLELDSERALVDRLVTAGLLGSADEERSETTPHRASARGVLAARGRALCFAPDEPGGATIELLPRFATLAWPTLFDVTFDALEDAIIARTDDTDVAFRRPAGEATTELWLAIRLLNRLLEDRDVRQRFAALDGEDCVVFGPPEALLALERDRLLLLARPDGDPTASGDGS